MEALGRFLEYSLKERGAARVLAGLYYRMCWSSMLRAEVRHGNSNISAVFTATVVGQCLG